VKKNGILLVISLILVIMALLAPTRLVAAQGAGSAEVGFFSDYEVAPGDLVEVPIQIRDVTDLYAVDLTFTFDPTVVTVEDGNSNRPGVQPALGTFLEAGMTLFNTVDVETGEVHFAMSQVNPGEPKSGDGILLVLYVRGLTAGETALTITNLEMSDRFGDAIAGTPVDGQISVSADAPQSDATAIPVQDATRMVEVPTLAATNTPEVTATPMPTPTQLSGEGYPSDEDGTGATQSAYPQESPTVNVDDNAERPGERSILDYWWVGLIAMVVFLGVLIFRQVLKK
jgi:hypothetical protein